MANQKPMVSKRAKDTLERTNAGAFPGVVNIREDGDLVYSNKDILWGVKTSFPAIGSNSSKVFVVCGECKKEHELPLSKLLNKKTNYQSLYCTCSNYLGVETKQQFKDIVDRNKEFFTSKEQDVNGIIESLPENKKETSIDKFGFGGVYVH